MLLDLNSYIKVDSIKRELKRSCVIVSNIEEADNYVRSVCRGELHNVIFEKSSLKSYCFGKIANTIDINVINCNSCLERFCENLQIDAKITIFDNVNNCRNIDILEIVLNKKGILAC